MASPAHRPPLPLRVVAAMLGVMALVFAGLLMLSDRAPGALQRIGGAMMRRLFARIDVDPHAADALADPAQGDAVVHVAVWAVAVVLVGWALWTWIGLLVGAAGVLVCSVVLEELQGRLTTTREVDRSDVEANLLGVTVGFAAVAACYMLYSLLRSLSRSHASPA